MRWLSLHLRARHAPAAAAVAGLAAVTAWGAWLLASDTRQIGPPTTAFAVALAAVAAARTFSGADESLDRTAAVDWPRLRAVHLVVVFALLLGLFAVSLPGPAQFGPFALVVRDGAGLLGLSALGSVLLGSQRAWFAPIAWCVIALPYGGSAGRSLQVLTWMIQPVDVGAAAVTSIVLAVAGAGAFVRGRTRLPRSEAL